MTDRFQKWTLLDSAAGVTFADASTIEPSPFFRCENRRLKGGLREGVDVAELSNNALRITIVPTRGMGIADVRCGDIRLGYPALRHMVVIGHSQGGLLTKLTVVDSGTVFWDQLILVPIEEFELEPETRAIAERSLFFEPLPFVRRVIFIATPHRGSFVAERWRVRIASNLVSLPGELLEASVALLDWDDDRVLLRSLDDLPSSIDNMTSDNRFLVSLAGMPIAEGVTAHSIIAVQGDGPPEEGTADRGDHGGIGARPLQFAPVSVQIAAYSGNPSPRARISRAKPQNPKTRLDGSPKPTRAPHRKSASVYTRPGL